MTIVLAASLQAQWSTDPNNNLIVGYGLDPHICSDSAGGCYITYDYNSTSYPRWLALERLDKYGYKPWGTLKRILGELPEQSGAQIVEDGEGGVIVSYKDRFENLPSWTQSIRVQRVDSNGNFLWGQRGVRVTLEEINQGQQHLVTDGSGGCVVTWKTISSVFYVNRINSNGERVWGDNGKVLGISNYSGTIPKVIRAADGNYYVETGEYIYRIRQNGDINLWENTTEWGLIVTTPDGGGILHSSIWNPSFYKLLAQRKDTLGNNLWQKPYVQIADSLFINTQLRISNNDNYYYYGWSGKKAGVDQVAQFQALRLDGSILFDNGSIPLMNRQSSLNSIVPSDFARTIFIYWNHPNLPDSTIAQVYDTLANKFWHEDGVLVGHPAIVSHSFTTDGRGGFIIGGTINEFTIVVQQVSKYGNLGEIITSISSEENKEMLNGLTLNQNFPNPFNSSSTIQYSVPSYGNIVIELFNTLGEKIKTLVNKFHTKGVYTINLSSDDLSSGIYLYKLQTDTRSITKKLIIIK